MKSKFFKLLLVVTFVLGVVGVTDVAQAYWRQGWYGGPRYYYGGPVVYSHGPYYYRHGCRRVPGHWAYGYWYPAHRVCW